MPLGLLYVGSLASGYAYAGDPQRGAFVALGETAALTAAMAVSLGIAIALFGNGQSAGFGLPLIGTPIVGATWIGVNVWKMADLHAVVAQKNREARGDRE